ncbi:MAG: glycoside hydrolase family 5 protein [Polyangiaceae bacterium]|jgi:hypothetical protein
MRFQPTSELRLLLFALLAGCSSVAGFAGCFSNSDTPSTSGAGAPGTAHGASGPEGCAVAGGAPKVAPSGYYTNGAQVCSASGEPHIFQGVDRPSLEWSADGDHISAQDFLEMGQAWHANVVRIAMNQDFWLSNASLYSPNYAATIDQAVTSAELAGLDVILDLHWSDQGNLSAQLAGTGIKNDTAGYSMQQPMADANSVMFWAQVASRYKGDGHVLFELYNEPNGIDWDTWLNGGTFEGYVVAGMQQLYNAVRVTAGADNVVIAGGLSWAFDLSGVATHPIQGYNVMYATHPYRAGDPESEWSGYFGYLAAQNIAPVIVTEFGDNESNCTGAWDTSLIQYAQGLQISWTAWAWYPGGCSFPSLISDWSSYTPTVQGVAVQAALAQLPAPTSWIATDASSPEGSSSEGSAEDVSADAGDASVATVDGSGANGTTADGTTADGTTADGTTADGTTADGANE